MRKKVEERRTIRMRRKLKKKSFEEKERVEED